MQEAKAILEKYRGIKGLYLLLLHLEEGYYNVGKLYTGVLPSGTYAYIGSAWGPGGLDTRVSRHLSANKRIHWHIDWLTSDTRCKLIGVYLFPRVKGESEMYRILSKIGECVILGFGSTDDRSSKCHLLLLKKSLKELEDVLQYFYLNYVKILL